MPSSDRFIITRMRNVLQLPHSSGGRQNADDEPRLPEPAYAVPLRVDRTRAPVYRITNVGHEQLIGLTYSLLGSGVMNSPSPRNARRRGDHRRHDSEVTIWREEQCSSSAGSDPPARNICGE